VEEGALVTQLDRLAVPSPRRTPLRLSGAAALTALAAAGAIFAAGLAGGGTAAASGSKGAVNVLYAGSLVDLMEKVVGPHFDRATGYSFKGFSAGSTALASEIKGKTQKGDVFLSAGTAADASLQGSANGGWVSWYAQFATTPLLLGYNPHSRFAHDLRTMPWYKVVTMPGFRLGRTDPAIDPKGVLAINALEQAARVYKDQALASLTKQTAGVFPEETLVGRLQAGQLDAGFFYGVEAKAAGFPTVTLAKIKLTSPYTITVLNHAPDAAGAKAFVSYLLGAKGSALLRAYGLALQHPAHLSGPRSAVPSPLRKLVS
jgi:molybdate transport system substrate-binding protein